jgi:hypothetical protein
MRHSASLLASLEGMSRATYRISRELANNSRSGLTVRFLAKKLELPEEEVEYLLDIHPKLLFTDLTKIKLVPEGHSAVKRISAGLENHGDVPSLFRLVKSMSAHDSRRLEEQVGIENPTTKRLTVEELLARHYKHPDAVLTYVATRGFSNMAREIFDVLWQSKDGVMPISRLRVVHGGPEFEVEQALWELFRGFACFELFRFDAEDRLVRMAGILTELRQFRDNAVKGKGKQARLKTVRGKPDYIQQHGTAFADMVCQLVAALAARPARLRGDGELFREDRRRLGEICDEEDEPSLNTCLWIAEGVGWLARVDNTLCAGELETLVSVDRIARLRLLFEWLFSKGDSADARHLLTSLLEEVKIGAWYSTVDFVHYSVNASAEHEQPVLRASGAHWNYVSPSTSGKMESRFARALEEAFFWLGIIDRADLGGDNVFRITPLGDALLTGRDPSALHELFPTRKGEFVVQPNFDIVVPTEDMDPLLTVPLDQFARRVSSGQATVYNVAKETFTHAIQEGHDANAFVEFLMQHNRGDELPNNVMRTLEDWRGGMKRVRIRTIQIIESDDPLVMADLMHRRKLKKHFVAIEPEKKTEYTGIQRSELARLLEKDGFVVD